MLRLAGIVIALLIAGSAQAQDGLILQALEALDYPPLARSARFQGRVVVAVKLDATGRVVSAQIEKGPPVIAPAAIANAKKWRFRTNVAQDAEIIYDFEIDENCTENGSRFNYEAPNLARITACRYPIQVSSRGK
jgi:TonB family protein